VSQQLVARLKTPVVAAVLSISVFGALAAGSTTASADPGRPDPSPAGVAEPSNVPDAALESRKKLPASAYGGLTYDSATDVTTVYLTDTSEANRQVVKGGKDSARFEFVRVRHSEAALSEVRDRVTTDAAWFRANGIRLSTWGPIPTENKVRIGLSEATDAQKAQVVERFGSDLVDVVDGEPTGQLAASRLADVAPWNGGDFLAAPGYGDCSSGPTVRNSSGATFLLTAGHCFPNGTTVQNGMNLTGQGSFTPIGSVQNRVLTNGGYDYAMINAAASKLVWANDPTRYAQVAASSDYVGNHICTSGAFELQICNGEVIQTNMCANFETTPGNFITLCALNKAVRRDNLVLVGAGDSGGPVYNHTTGGVHIRGIITGHPGNPGPCVRWTQRGNECSTTVYYTDIHTILTRLGVQINK